MDSLLPSTDPSTKNNPLPPRKRHRSYTPTTDDNTDITVQSVPPRKRHELYTKKEELKRQLMPPPPPRKPNPSCTPKDDDNNEVVIQSMPPPRKRHDQSFTMPTNDDNKQDTASETITVWKKLHEINLLQGILDYNQKNNTYPFDNSSNMQEFYHDWMKQHSVNVDEDAFSDKMVELPEKFFNNQYLVLAGKNIEGWSDPLEGKIYDLSHKIWGKGNDDR